MFAMDKIETLDDHGQGQTTEQDKTEVRRHPANRELPHVTVYGDQASLTHTPSVMFRKNGVGGVRRSAAPDAALKRSPVEPRGQRGAEYVDDILDSDEVDDLEVFPPLLTQPPPEAPHDDDISVKGVGCGRHMAAELLALQARAAEQAEQLVRRIWEAGWEVMAHHHLPNWLQDNDFLLKGHRPQLHSFYECFKSMFRIHTETGNIWTHLIGCVAFVAASVYFFAQPSAHVQWQEKLVFGIFFFCAILCLSFSWIFHTVCCHSELVGKIFSKLDYCGISIMIIGSFVPWIYYSFYCHQTTKITYLTLIVVFGLAVIVVTLWDKFGHPKYRKLRAGLFITYGCCGVVPAVHYVATDGTESSTALGSVGWLLLMAFFYITGAMLYAMRIPERFFPGRFDIWFQSHQIFHVFVVTAAFIHYHGVSTLAAHRLTFADCLVP